MAREYDRARNLGGWRQLAPGDLVKLRAKRGGGAKTVRVAEVLEPDVNGRGLVGTDGETYRRWYYDARIMAVSESAESTPKVHVDPEQRRIKHFLRSADDYANLRETLPLGSFVTGAGSPEGNAARWRLALHAMVLRKYYASRDKVALNKVVAAVERVYGQKIVPSLDQADGWPELEAVQFEATGESVSDIDLTWNVLYGRYLHADFERWDSVQRHGLDMGDLALFLTTTRRGHTVLAIAAETRRIVEMPRS